MIEKVEYVVWAQTGAYEGEASLDAATRGARLFQTATVGILLKEDQEKVVLTNELSKDRRVVRGVTIIPTRSIIRRYSIDVDDTEEQLRVLFFPPHP